jgi:hypothetical protein
MTLSYTARLKLAVPDFLTEPWHGEFAAAMDSIDRIIYDALLSGNIALWTNSTAYIIGNVVVGTNNGQLYVCAVNHTSSASPTTFAQELVAHPTFWTSFAPTLATQAEAEAGVENSHFMSALRTKQAIAALTSTPIPATPNCGILRRASATQLSFTPYGGNQIKINGQVYQIPVAGIAGLANTGVIINSVGGQSLAANTPYAVYASISGGVVTAQYGTIITAHRPSQAIGNEGVEVYWDGIVESNPLSFIGSIRTNASSQFVDTVTQRFVRSWYNRSTIPLVNFFTAATLVPSTVYSEVSSSVRLEWVNFANETVRLDFSAPFYQAGGLVAVTDVSIGLDSTTVAQNAWGGKGHVVNENYAVIPVGLNVQPAEGYHFASVLARYGTNQTTLFVIANVDGSRPTFRGILSSGGL